MKQCKGYAEEARVSVRNIRRDANNALQKAQKDNELTEDDVRGGEAAVQKLTDKFIAEIEEMLKNKEAEVMEI